MTTSYQFCTRVRAAGHSAAALPALLKTAFLIVAFFVLPPLVFPHGAIAAVTISETGTAGYEVGVPAMEADEPAPSSSLSYVCDGAFLLPGVVCELTLSVTDAANLQYAGLELDYDPERFDFEQILPGDLFGADAVVFARPLPDGSLGASVSSTSGEQSGSGSLLHLQFRIRDGADAGTAGFAVNDIEFTDRDAVPLEIAAPDPVDIDIPPYLADAGLTAPGPVTIARGSEQLFRFRLAASGITEEDISASDRLEAEFGIIASDASLPDAPAPEAWDAAEWLPLTLTEFSDGHFRFETLFPIDQPVGSWLVLGRFQLDDQPELYAAYGSDGGGIWDGDQFTAPEVTVTTPRVTIAEWTFDGEHWSADTGLYANLDPDSPAVAALHGARFSGWTGGNTGRAPNSNQWHVEQNNGSDNNGGTGDNGDNGGTEDNGGSDGGSDSDANGDSGDNGGGSDNGTVSGDHHHKYWSASLTTQGHDQLALRFYMSGSGTGPRDFRLYFQTDNSEGESGNGSGSGSPTEWTPVPGGDIQVGTSWSAFDIPLPADASDAGRLNLRWVRIDSTSINGDVIGTSGTNRIDDIRITGVPLEQEEMTVWPGNTRGEGTVSEADVINLALYWMATGPARVPQSIEWAPQPVTRWLPAPVGHADTNGDGRIDYRDLLAIGRNFGETAETGVQPKAVTDAAKKQKTGDNTALAAFHLPGLSKNETVRLVLSAQDFSELLGLSARFSISGIDAADWELLDVRPGDWAESWSDASRLITFHHGRSPASLSANRHKLAHSPDADISAGTDLHSSQSGRVYLTDESQSSVSGIPAGWSSAWAHKGMGRPSSPSESGLAVIELRALSDWNQAPVLSLDRASFTTGSDGLQQPARGDWKFRKDGRGVFTDPDPGIQLPQETRLHANYPNPFNPVTAVPFDLHQPGHVAITVYDALGRRVDTLMDARMEPGRHEISWDAGRLASGVYLIRMETGTLQQVRTMMLVK